MPYDALVQIALKTPVQIALLQSRINGRRRARARWPAPTSLLRTNATRRGGREVLFRRRLVRD